MRLFGCKRVSCGSQGTVGSEGSHRDSSQTGGERTKGTAACEVVLKHNSRRLSVVVRVLMDGAKFSAHHERLAEGGQFGLIFGDGFLGFECGGRDWIFIC